MIVLLFLSSLVLTAFVGCRFVLRHSRREAARLAAWRDVADQEFIPRFEGDLGVTDVYWTDLDDRQLARYITEVSSS